jgi:asparaginyl-tRNA synthetase
MKTKTVKKLFLDSKELDQKQIYLAGWVRNNRAQKAFGFIDLNDGTCFETLQIVYESNTLENFKDVQKIRVGSSIEITGILVLTPNSKQPFEIKATSVSLIGDSQEDYPIQPKRHTREFLRDNAHLRVRTNLFNAVFRVRSVVSHAIHKFFQEQDYIYVHTPLITTSDAEGAGEMFQVTTLDIENTKEIDYSKDFFTKKANLSVSGQLQAEAYALAFKNVYTFGPTFRAENSNTKLHASEFWMIEPEIAFADLHDDMKLAENMIKYIIEDVFKRCPSEINFFDRFVEKGLKQKLQKVLKSTFKVVTHKEAIDILLNSDEKFENKPKHGEDLATEHEKHLTKHFDGPVFVIDWPKDIKAFYMRLNDDKETVAAMDLLVPKAGELLGGSQREERLDVLEERIKEFGIDDKDLWWYKDLRKYGGCKHAGFGLGLERMVMYVTGIDNIRDVIPFPRTPRNCEF